MSSATPVPSVSAPSDADVQTTGVIRVGQVSKDDAVDPTDVTQAIHVCSLPRHPLRLNVFKRALTAYKPCFKIRVNSNKGVKKVNVPSPPDKNATGMQSSLDFPAYRRSVLSLTSTIGPNVFTWHTPIFRMPLYRPVFLSHYRHRLLPGSVYHQSTPVIVRACLTHGSHP